jgi:hypothetical protein
MLENTSSKAVLVIGYHDKARFSPSLRSPNGIDARRSARIARLRTEVPADAR